MRPSFLPRLVNGPFDDPGLFAPMAFKKRALIFDLGDLGGLAPGDLLKISHVFVSHTHMDHFSGFDHLLRLLLGRPVHLHLYGPPGFLTNINGKLQSYTWNLLHNYADALKLTATEIHPDKRLRQVFDARKNFSPSDLYTENLQDNILVTDPAFVVSTAILDHRIACLAFAVQERFHINIMKAKLEELGLTVGPWVSRFKALLYQKADPDTEIQVTGVNTLKKYHIGKLSQEITRISPGQKFAYVVDAVYSDENCRKIVELVKDADQLFIEAAFMEKDHTIALEKNHLTAHQAGILARKANAKSLTIFHHSPRYSDQQHLLEQEAQTAFNTV